MSNTKNSDSGAAEGARRATEQSPESGRAGAGRWSSRRKMAVILELLRGADVESTSRKYRVTAATLAEWRESFLAAGEAGRKSRELNVEDEEKRRLKSVVASVSVENELLREKIAHMEGNRPLAPWRSRP
jgi:transposase